jgi:hypothetical protein
MGALVTEVQPAVPDRRSAPRPRRLWEKVRENVRHIQSRMEQEWERLRVNEALGRRVSRPVWSAEGPIADPGDRITPAVVERARASGVLPLLLDAAEERTELRDTRV